MPDANTPLNPPVGSDVESWHGAFAALPLESPPTGGWDAVSTHLQVRPRRWPAWLAIAAAMALAIGLPLHWAWHASDLPAAGTGLAASQATHVADMPSQVAHAPARPPVDASTRDTPASEAITHQSIVDQRTPTPVPGRSSAASRLAAVRSTAAPSPAAPSTAVPKRTSAASNRPPAASQAELARLHAESARLEAVLALTRDERVSSAGAALLGEHFDDQLGTIDTALMQATLTDRQRLGLWRARVSALRQLAGLASTQRVLAAYGQRDDARLASIY